MNEWEFRARWMHRSGFETSGTFVARTSEEVKETIRADGGYRIEVFETGEVR